MPPTTRHHRLMDGPFSDRIVLVATVVCPVRLLRCMSIVFRAHRKSRGLWSPHPAMLSLRVMREVVTTPRVFVGGPAVGHAMPELPCPLRRLRFNRMKTARQTWRPVWSIVFELIWTGLIQHWAQTGLT